MTTTMTTRTTFCLRRQLPSTESEVKRSNFLLAEKKLFKLSRLSLKIKNVVVKNKESCI